MTIPAVTVTAFFDLTYEGGDYFTLDDAVKGQLDDTTYLLGGVIETDITDYVAAVSTQRGRSIELDEFSAGTCTVTLHDYDADLIPEGFVSGGTYASNVGPGRRVQVKVAGHCIFDGTLQDWWFDYDADRSVRVGFTADDALAALGRRSMTGWTTTAQSSGDRINAVLDLGEIDWGPNRSIDDGLASLQADAISDGTNALTYLQLVGRTEFGRFFADRTNRLTFRERFNTTSFAESVSSAILDPGGSPLEDESTDEILDESDASMAPSAEVAVFADDGSAYDFKSAQLSYGSSQLYTDVTVTAAGGTPQSASNSTARDTFGIRRLDLSGLLMSSDIESSSMAEWLAGIYSSPLTRIPQLTVNMAALTEAQHARMAILDISHVATVQWTPRGAGSQLDIDFIVEGVGHEVTNDGQQWLNISLSPVTGVEVLRLDVTVLGVLGVGVLGF